MKLYTDDRKAPAERPDFHTLCEVRFMLRSLRLAFLAFLIPCASCATESLSMNKQERFFSRAHSAEGRVKNYVDRYNWAKEKSVEYSELVEASETELATLRASVIELRGVNQQKAQELEGLAQEDEKLKKDLEARKAAVAAQKAALAKEEQELAALKKKKADQDAARAKLRQEVEAAAKAHPAAARRLKAILRDL